MKHRQQKLRDQHSYTASVVRYAITDSRRFGDELSTRRNGLIAQVERLATAGVEYIQLREKDLDAGDLLMLAEEISRVLQNNCSTKLLVNSRADVAVSAKADGVHLTSHPDELTPEQMRTIFSIARSRAPMVSVSCHTLEDVQRGRDHGADLLLFGPVFEKRIRDEVLVAGAGLAALRNACHAAGSIPVLALGGVTETNAQSCLESGAAGIAGIRLFQ